MTKPDRQPSTSARTASNSLPKRPALTRGQTQVQRPIKVNARPVSSSRRGGVSSITRNGAPGSYTILNNQQNKVRKLPSPQRKNTRARTSDNPHKLVLMLLSQQTGAAGSSRHSQGINARPGKTCMDMAKDYDACHSVKKHIFKTHD